MEVLTRRTVAYTRLTDPTEAAQVAMARSSDATDLGQAVTSAGATVIIEMIGAQVAATVEDIRAGIERAKIEAETRRLEIEKEPTHHEPDPDPAPTDPAPADPATD
jgi:hypothetical protein